MRPLTRSPLVHPTRDEYVSFVAVMIIEATSPPFAASFRETVAAAGDVDPESLVSGVLRSDLYAWSNLNDVLVLSEVERVVGIAAVFPASRGNAAPLHRERAGTELQASQESLIDVHTCLAACDAFAPENRGRGLLQPLQDAAFRLVARLWRSRCWSERCQRQRSGAWCQPSLQFQCDIGARTGAVLGLVKNAPPDRVGRLCRKLGERKRSRPKTRRLSSSRSRRIFSRSTGLRKPASR